MIADSLSVATYRYPRCVRASGPGDLAAAERRNDSSGTDLLSLVGVFVSIQTWRNVR